MQLILADTTSTQIMQARAMVGNVSKIAYAVFVKELNIQAVFGCNNDTELAKSLVNEITAKGEKLSNLHIVFQPQSVGEDYNVLLQNAKNNDGLSLLGNLWGRFPHGVTMSLEVEHSAGVDDEGKRKKFKIVVCGQGLLFPEEGAKYFHLTFPYQRRVDLNGISASSVFRARIIAHIPDDLLNPGASLARMTNKRILEDGVSSDVIIETGNGVEIKTHKCFLISTSSVFERMFANEMQERRNGRITINDISEEGIRAFLRFIYHGNMIGLQENLDLAYNLLYAAQKYDVKNLEASMKTYLLGRKDEDFPLNVAFKVYSLVRRLENAAELKAKMVGYMSLKYDELIELPEFKEVFEINPRNAMKLCSNLVKIRPPPPSKRKYDSAEINPGKKAKPQEN